MICREEEEDEGREDGPSIVPVSVDHEEGEGHNGDNLEAGGQ